MRPFAATQNSLTWSTNLLRLFLVRDVQVLDDILVRRYFRFSDEGGAFLDHKASRLQISNQLRTRVKFTAFLDRDIAMHFALNNNGLALNFSANIRVFADRQNTVNGGNLAFQISIKNEF